MKRSFALLMSLAALVIIPACQKVAPVQDDPATKKQVTVTASIPADGITTRVALTQDATSKKTIKLSWENDDEIAINGVPFAIDPTTISSDGKTAKFTGDDPGSAPYTIVYSDLPGTFALQIQSEDGNTDHLGYSASLAGVTDYEVFSFDSEWAAANGATLAQSSVLRLRALLPEAVASDVQNVIFKASEAVFGGSNTLEVMLTTPGTTGTDNELDVYATLPAGDVTLTADMDLLIQFQVSDAAYDKYTAYRKVASGTHFIVSGQSQYMGIKCANIEQYAGTNDAGTEANPYLIGDQHQMDAMHVMATSGAKTYFKMVDDVDLDGIAWTPLNVPSPYDIGIDFNGNGKTINHLSATGKYASFAGVLNGSIYNVIFENATIQTSQDKAGVVAGYLGSSGSGISAECHDITIKKSKVTSTSNNVGGLAGIASKMSAGITNCHVIDFEGSGVFYIGGLLGCLDGVWTVSECTTSGTISSSNTESNKDICLGGLIGDMKGAGTITKCSSSVNVNQTKNGRDLGGLVGRLQAGTVEKSFSTGNVKGMQRNVGGFIGLITNTSGTSSVSNCYSTGNVSANAYSGGFLGLFEKGNASISNCYASGDVEGSGFGLGGIIGFAAAATMTMSKSVAWNGKVVPANFGSGNWSSGAVVGVTFPLCTMTNNYRNPSMSLTAFWVPDAGFDHPDVSSSTPLVIKDISTGEIRPTTATGTGSGNDNYPQFAYHGKHVAAGTSLSTLASNTLGWSSDVWDFSGELPTLK